MIRFRLAEILAVRKIKATDIYKKTGIAKSTISGVVNNNSEMVRLSTIDGICRYLEITPAELFEYLPFEPFVEFGEEEFEIENEPYGLTYHGVLNLVVKKNVPTFKFFYSIWVEDDSLQAFLALKKDYNRYKVLFGPFVEDVKKIIFQEVKEYGSLKFKKEFKKDKMELMLLPLLEGEVLSRTNFDVMKNNIDDL